MNLTRLRPDDAPERGLIRPHRNSFQHNPSVTWGSWIGVGSPSESCKAGLQRKVNRRSGGIQSFYGYAAFGHRSNVPPQASPESPPRSCTRGSPLVTEGIRGRSGWIRVGSRSESCKAGLQRKVNRRSGGIQPFYGYAAFGHRSNVPQQASPESPPRSCTRGSPLVTEGIPQIADFS